MKLFVNALVKFLLGILLVGALLFLPAGTLWYYNGWLFMGILFFPLLVLGIVLWLHSPELLKKRLNGKEKQSAQKGVVAFSGLIFTGGFVVASLDFRFGWSEIPKIVVFIACGVFLAGYTMYAEVMRENRYLSRTVEVQENQKVIDTGLYGVVRHPMYLATVFMFLAIPLVLGSWWAFLVFLIYPILLIVRIQNEEKVLTEQLEGYKEYCQKVKYKLIPYIW